MKPLKSMRHQFRTTLVSTVLAMVIFAVFMIGLEVWRLGDTLARSLSSLYTDSLVQRIESQLSRELSLSSLMSRSFVLRDWLRNPEDKAVGEEAYTIMKAFGEESKSKNIFWVNAETNEIYFSEMQHTNLLKPSGVLHENLSTDRWYFDTLESPNAYTINVDTDRILNTMRVWINYKVYDGGKVTGVVGTGLTMDQMVSKVFDPIINLGAESVIIDNKGQIQLYAKQSQNIERINEMAKGLTPSIYKLEAAKAFRTDLEHYLAQKKPLEHMKISAYGTGWNRYYAIASIKNTDWYVVSLFSVSGLIHPTTFLPLLALVLFSILALGSLVDLIVRRLILVPFESLRQSLQNREMGSERPLHGIERSDEFGELVRSIQEMSDRMVASVPVGLFLLDFNGKLIYANPYCLDQLGYKDSQSLSLVLSEHPERIFKQVDDLERFLTLTKQHQSIPNYELQLIHGDGSAFWAEFRLSMVEKAEGQIHFEGIMLNIQSKKDYEAQLVNLAIKDPLTGLHNRYFFEQAVAEEVIRSDKHGSALSMIILDLDHFKKVNDVYGHDIGDVVLKSVSETVKLFIRESDKLVRWGGEEFALLLPDTPLTGAVRLAEKLRMRIEESQPHKDIKVTASFGVAQKAPYESSKEWFRRADQALLTAKSEGRNCVRSSVIGEHVEVPMHLNWLPQYASGHELIDRQHRGLFEAAERLLQSTFTSHGADTPHKIYREVVMEIEAHFVDEEALLASLDYPESDLDCHREKHRQLREQMKSLEYAMAFGTLKPVDVFMRVVDEMIMKHMLIEDAKFFGFLKTHSQKSMS